MKRRTKKRSIKHKSMKQSIKRLSKLFTKKRIKRTKKRSKKKNKKVSMSKGQMGRDSTYDYEHVKDMIDEIGEQQRKVDLGMEQVMKIINIQDGRIDQAESTIKTLLNRTKRIQKRRGEYDSKADKLPSDVKDRMYL